MGLTMEKKESFLIKIIKSIHNDIEDRELSIEERVGLMFISSGVIVAIIGLHICYFCHASINSLYAVSAIIAAAILTLLVGGRKRDINFTKNVMVVVVSLLIPSIFVTAGGINSGCGAWFIYEMFFIVLACKGVQLVIFLIVDSAVIALLFFMDYGEKTKYIYHLQTERDVFLSTVLSWCVVTFVILFIVYEYKRIYNDEKRMLESKSAELEKANSYERNFLVNMSHELRTPITSVVGFNELVLNEKISDEARDYAKKVEVSSEYLLSIVDNILDFEKIESGKDELQCENYYLKDIIDTSCGIVSKNINDKGLSIAVVTDPALPSQLYGDVRRINQVLLNLLTNAIKYSEKGIINMSFGRGADIGTYKTHLIISVEDQGIGMSESDVENIFESYTKVGTLQSKRMEGVGLGLAISKKYIELMDGRIEVESRLGHGTKFTCVIPQTIVDDTPFSIYGIADANESMEDAVNTNDDSKNDDSKNDDEIKDVEKKSILVVDDTKMNLELIMQVLKNLPYEVSIAESGQQAVELCKIKKYSLILMDILMPEMDGTMAMKSIRQECYSDVPIVALTADAVLESRQAYKNEGFDDCIVKPVKPAVLLATIEEYVH